MNRISAYVGSGSGDFGGAYFPNTSHDVSIQSRDRSEVSTQRPLPPVMRVQPLHSPWPPNGTVLFAPQQPRLEQQEQRPIPRPVPHTNAGVQTDPTTEDAIAVKPLTIERDETLTKRVHSPEQTEPSVSSLCPPRPNGPASGEATLSGSVRSDSKPSPLAETRTDEERGAKPLEKTGASTPSNETRNTQQTVIAAENARTPKQQVYISPQPQLTSDAKGVIISSPVPIRVHLMPLSPPPESSAASATAAAAGRGLVGGAGATWESGYDDALRQGAVDHMLQFPPLTTPRTAAWYLPTSRVLEPAEFRNLLRGDWMPPPRSVQVAEATVDWSPPVTSRGISVSPTPIPTQEVEPTSPPPPVAPLAAAETAAMPSLHAELRDPAPRVEDYIVEFPPGPDLPVPDMPPPGTHRKSKCSCTCSRPCAPRCHFSRHFPFIKRGRKNKGGNTSGL
ncbi:hypothetical protein DQ04_07641030 [Trypanosoma grayi]|uniref:hypothetical protein n=1 Tax=Trypanosoma grayi TaxID=71804 RepID=UPI0004F48E9A|nr:hypothetical protein DQ04_07641030 [Trypanosoma grayi]KEG08246.1 hypothetical protein DQ04_07641030 [Trypanosoma grayi]